MGNPIEPHPPNHCHMHVHSEYSSLDGYIKIPALVRQVVDDGQPAISITDHGFLGGLLEFFKACESINNNPEEIAKAEAKGRTKGEPVITPIAGMELYIVNDRTQRVKGEHNKHLLVHARNEVGYKNLLKLHYEGYATGSTFVFDRLVPRIDRSLLTRKTCEGLIATTGCMGSEIHALLREDKWQEAINLGEYYKKIFDEFYAELQPHYLVGEEQAAANDKIIHLAKILDIKLICTTDSHYLTDLQRDEHQLILAIQSKKDMNDDSRFCFEATPLLSTKRMIDLFGKEIVSNTEAMARSCKYPSFLRFKGYRLPKYPVPADIDYEKWKEGKFAEEKDESYKYCMYLVEKNWKRKLHYAQSDLELEKKYQERLETEVGVIKTMGFIDYFLIVWDFVDWCKKNGIMTGCGRGSAGGCLLSYLLGITKLDPLKYDLLFSRFLNADRVSLPDIDMDIDKARRDEVKDYLASKYGRDHVASIATFSTMKVRACIKDIVRSLCLGGSKAASFELADKLNKTLEEQNDDITFGEAMEIPEFRRLIKSEEYAASGKYKSVHDYAQNFEGLIRQTGIHAAGVIIGAEPLTDTIPLMMDKKGVVSTAYDGTTLEKDGFLKMDLLGLKNLTIITDTLNNIERVRGQKFSGFYTRGIDIFYDEPDAMFEQRLRKTSEGRQKASLAFKLLRDGKCNGVFQVEGQTMRELLRGVHTNSIEDVAAVLALCRPGPLASGLTAEYGKRKRSGEDRDEWYKHSSLKPILGKTYGIIVYQEQCMQIAVQCAGFTEPESDTLRKAIGKKIHDLMMAYKEKFIAGAMKKSGMDKLVAEAVFEDINAFASYGFNKCLSYNTLLQTTDGRTLQIGDLAGENVDDIKMFSVDNSNNLIENQVIEVFCTGENEVFEIEFEDGRKVECTKLHKFLCADGQFHTVQEIIDKGLDVINYEKRLES